ncbi:inactive leucine-rich repeat receptor-like serine/threonine-protein kinase At1g60630 [Pistacia vera]|uniref:inactive leucine-rich repeat receptor-like serine/threonine-protein kinase At1g60630 n=1 Tax=Pistacia vera TaxID=55513 RepID=UPI001263AE55|nr:inactive leucine-rich repeat receptor-like serine/threonine-protein kinase At1g60630 [Pistacia vera]
MQGKEKAKAEQEVDRFVELSGKKMATLWSSEDPERTVELEFLDRTIPVFYLDDLLRASAKVLGKGKLGSTYKATLELGSVVVVKRVKNMNGLSKKRIYPADVVAGKDET